MKKIIIIITPIIFFILCSCLGQKKDTTYLNYVASLRNESTFQYFLVIKVKNKNTGEVRDYCTKGDFLKGALHRELNIGYNSIGCSKVKQIAIKNKKRYFEFKNDSAIWNIGGVWEYSIKDLSNLENQVNFDSLATAIKKEGKWSKQILDDKQMLMYAHALFNRGILTGENNCFGGTLEYIDITKDK